MFHGRASRSPLRRALPRLLPALVLIAGGAAYTSGWVRMDGESARALVQIPRPGGAFLVFEHHLFGLALLAGGVGFLVAAVRLYRRDRADARRAREARR